MPFCTTCSTGCLTIHCQKCDFNLFFTKSKSNRVLTYLREVLFKKKNALLLSQQEAHFSLTCFLNHIFFITCVIIIEVPK
jgi:hypothetical protein